MARIKGAMSAKKRPDDFSPSLNTHYFIERANCNFPN